MSTPNTVFTLALVAILVACGGVALAPLAPEVKALWDHTSDFDRDRGAPSLDAMRPTEAPRRARAAD